jgi:hypothetical protein
MCQLDADRSCRERAGLVRRRSPLRSRRAVQQRGCAARGQGQTAARAGFRTVWSAQAFGWDALTMLAALALEQLGIWGAVKKAIGRRPDYDARFG